MKIAVVGSGISGLMSAWLLGRAHDVQLFEAADRAGGHTHTHELEINGQQCAVDTGFIVYNERTYPNFIRLMSELGVATQRSSMSFSAANTRTKVEWSGTSIDSLFAQRRNLITPSHWHMLIDILRFNRLAPKLLLNDEGLVPGEAALSSGWLGEGGNHPEREISLGEFLRQHHFSRSFTDNYIIGMGAAIWSTPANQVLDFPARAFVRFFANHGLMQLADRPQWHVVSGGSCRYVDKLLADFSGRIHLSSAVRNVIRNPEAEGAAIQLDIESNGTRHTADFDAVVLACHSDEALAMLGDADEAERRLLGAIRYQENEAVLHTDTQMLPRSKRAWASWNYRVPEDTGAPVAVTYWMNSLQGLDIDTDVCVSLNAQGAIAPEHVLRRMQYAHPVFSTEALRAQQELPQINGNRNTWYAGAWTRHGFHEDGVLSAVNVAQGLGVSW